MVLIITSPSRSLIEDITQATSQLRTSDSLGFRMSYQNFINLKFITDHDQLQGMADSSTPSFAAFPRSFRWAQKSLHPLTCLALESKGYIFGPLKVGLTGGMPPVLNHSHNSSSSSLPVILPGDVIRVYPDDETDRQDQIDQMADWEAQGANQILADHDCEFERYESWDDSLNGDVDYQGILLQVMGGTLQYNDWLKPGGLDLVKDNGRTAMCGGRKEFVFKYLALDKKHHRQKTDLYNNILIRVNSAIKAKFNNWTNMLSRHCVILLEPILQLNDMEKAVADHLTELQNEIDNRIANPSAERILAKIETVIRTQAEFSGYLSNLEQLLTGRPLDKNGPDREIYLRRNDFLAHFGGCASASMGYSVPIDACFLR